jgi:CNT family concentrative nucleoside transporter
LSFLNLGAVKLLAFAKEGSRFVFGELTNAEGPWGFLFFALVLPSIIFMSSLMSVLYHLGLMQKVVQALAWLMMKSMRVSGAEAVAAASNIFVGQTEAPLLMALMTGGMATVAGGVLVAYVGMGISGVHLLAASVISAPASLLVAKLLVPEQETPLTLGQVRVAEEKIDSNLIDAATRGASEGLKLAANVAAMLLAMISLVALVNAGFSALGQWLGWEGLSLEGLLGYLQAPLAWLMGVPAGEMVAVGGLLGKKLVLNEFVAYADLVQLKDSLSERSQVVATYALCGFANIGSVAIQIGGIGALVPERKKLLAALGWKALVGGTLACYMTAAIAGVMV